MRQEYIATGKTVEAAVELGAIELGADVDKVTFEVLEQPKKGFLGLGETPAKVKVFCEIKPDTIAINFVRTLMHNMELDAEATIGDTVSTDGSKVGKNEKTIMISGESAGILIGHHGDTLDALQYLTNLAANKKEDEDDTRDYTRVTVDVENYRAKRIDTLRALARRMASKVLKYKKSITLEPMNPYERRIIHSEIQGIAGVTTNSIGSENNRKVVIYPEGGEMPSERGDRNDRGERSDREHRGDRSRRSSGSSRGGKRHSSSAASAASAAQNAEAYASYRASAPIRTKSSQPPKKTIDEVFGNSSEGDALHVFNNLGEDD